MTVPEEIKAAIYEKFPYADEIEIRDSIVNETKEDLYFVSIHFFEDDPINMIVLTYGVEYLDFFKFSFSKEREAVKYDRD
jgi:hypothetical protein